MGENILLPHHKQMLSDSAISDEVIFERGYRSITSKAELKRLGFADYQCLTPTLLAPIQSVAGCVGLYHHRPDHPRMNAKGKINKYEFPKNSQMVVDVHPRIRDKARDPALPLFITEGVKKADAAISIGLCCIAVTGTFNWRGTNEYGGKTALPDWESIALKNAKNEPRQVYICFDSDVMLKKQVYLALIRLSEFLKHRGASVAFIYLPHGEDASKTGLDDYLVDGHGIDDLMMLVSDELHKPAFDADSNGNLDSDLEDQSVSQKLIALASGVEFFHSERSDAYARVKINDHYEIYPVRSSAFKQWLSREYYHAYQKAAGAQAFDDAVRYFEGKSRFDGSEVKMNLRCARDESDGSIYLDMADDKWRAIRVDSQGWVIVDAPPPMFRKYVTQAPMCEPDPTATTKDIELLRKFCNVRSEAGWRQLIVWLMAAWIPEIAHPVLVVHGEQGTAKSTLMRLLSELIDPSRAPLRSEPKDEEAWIQAADHSWLLTVDNVSNMPGWLSDSICRAVTGAASVKRQLYTDSDDVLMAFRRVIGLTCIEVVARRSDLLDRSILLGLEPIAHGKRRSEKLINADYADVRPRLIGSLLSILSSVLGLLPSIEVETSTGAQLPRMADFANVGIAVERVLGWPIGSFMASYHEGIGEQNEEALSSAIIYDPLMAIVETQWSGSAQELLEALVTTVDEKIIKQTEWPKNAKSLSGQLRRIAPNLRAIEIEVNFKKSGRKRTLHITRRQPDICVPCVSDEAQFHEEWDARDANDAKSASFSFGGEGVDYISAIKA